MQKTLIVYAHPNKKGFCGEILRCTEDHLRRVGADYQIINLYEEQYDPVMKNEEHYTSGGYEISQENKKYQQLISDAKNLVFIFPTWWQGMPAILKGFFDRVLTPRFAFTYKGKFPVGLLKNYKATVFTTSAGPRIYTHFGAGDRAIKNSTKDILGFCGIKAKGVALGDAREMDELKKKEIEKKVSVGLNHLQ